MQEIDINSHISQQIKNAIGYDLVYYTAEALWNPWRLHLTLMVNKTTPIIQKIEYYSSSKLYQHILCQLSEKS